MFLLCINAESPWFTVSQDKNSSIIGSLPLLHDSICRRAGSQHQCERMNEVMHALHSQTHMHVPGVTSPDTHSLLTGTFLTNPFASAQNGFSLCPWNSPILLGDPIQCVPHLNPLFHPLSSPQQARYRVSERPAHLHYVPPGVGNTRIQPWERSCHNMRRKHKPLVDGR